MALFMNRFGKFMVKKGYCVRIKKSSSKNKEEARMCFKCNRKDHLIAECPYNSDNEMITRRVRRQEEKEGEEGRDDLLEE
jgi:hypothetical protein